MVVAGEHTSVSSIAAALERLRSELPPALRDLAVSEVGATTIVRLDEEALAEAMPMVRSVEFRLRSSEKGLHASYSLTPSRAPSLLVPLSAAAFFAAIAGALAARAVTAAASTAAVAAAGALLGGGLTTATWWRSCHAWPRDLLSRTIKGRT